MNDVLLRHSAGDTEHTDAIGGVGVGANITSH